MEIRLKEQLEEIEEYFKNTTIEQLEEDLSEAGNNRPNV